MSTTKGPRPCSVHQTAASETISVAKVAPRSPKRSALYTTTGKIASEAG
ncbi:MAG: hypothetical protein MO853_11275 [Candidatus Protistobacter heckmanni]|nr:hypothetical protein [Candidatus Protistobacter heckmanni]